MKYKAENTPFLVQENYYKNLVLVKQLSKKQTYNSSPTIKVSIQNKSGSAWSPELDREI